MPVKLTRRRLLTGAAAAFATPFLPAYAVTAPATLSPSAMRADVALLRRAYEALHPGLHRYLTPAESAARFDALADAAARPTTLPAWYLLLSRHLAEIRCGHSYANFYNQSKGVQAALFDAASRLPFHFLWLGDRMIVTADPHGTGIAPGSEVLAIDGRRAPANFAALMPYARADGGNDGKRRRLLSVQGEDGYETFDVFHALRFGGGPRYRLLVADPSGKRRTAVVDGVTLAERRATRPKRVDASDDTPQWTMERRGATALLTMPGWGLYNGKWDWRGWLDAEMDRLVADDVRRLVVDIRANEGGYDCGDVLAARLVEHPVAADPARRLVRYRRIPADLRPHLDTWDRGFDDWGEDAQPLDGRYFLLKGGRGEGGAITPKGPRFTGHVRVLIGPQNSSATFGFAELVRRARLGRLVGETTGGNRRGINGGAFYFLRLPGTGVEIDLPLIGYFPVAAQPDAGVEPDLRIARTARDIAADRDRVLETALRA